MVSNATWSPSYDLYATTEDGEPSNTVTLHYRASIQQSTGEDWSDTIVSVSTATAGQWTSIPALRAMRIQPGLSRFLSNGTKSVPSSKGPKTSFIVKGHSRNASMSASTINLAADTTDSVAVGEDQSIGSSDKANLPDEKDTSWTETRGIVSESAVSSSFRIEGYCTIPSESNSHKATIVDLTFGAVINHVAVPRSSPAAYIQVRSVLHPSYSCSDFLHS